MIERIEQQKIHAVKSLLDWSHALFTKTPKFQELPTFGKSFTNRTKTYKELSDVFEASVASVASCRLSENLNTDVANDKSVTVVLNLTVEDVDPIPRKGDLYFWDQFSKTIFAQTEGPLKLIMALVLNNVIRSIKYYGIVNHSS